jgi:hypothetical protein
MNNMKEYLKRKLNRDLYRFFKRIYLRVVSLPFGFSLDKLAQIYKSDKWGKHYYTKHYRTHFKKYKFRRIKLFEIGIGGYHHSDMGGNSLRMWKSYFPLGRIYALDIYDKWFVNERRIKTFQGNQTDEDFLCKVMDQIGEPDIIIDDGSHVNGHVIKTFQVLFPRLKMGGIYVIEDTETSYWPGYGGDSELLTNPSTIMNYFKSLTDCLNHQEFVLKNYTPSYFDENICSIQFYHNLIFVFKGKNNESSNIDWNNPDSILADVIHV